MTQLIGKAGRVVTAMSKQIDRGGPLRLLLYGDPGIGKSAACAELVSKIAAHSSAVSHISAGQLTVDHVRDWLLSMLYHCDGWRVFWIEEVDAVSPSVEVLLLQFLDQLPTRHAALFTSNASLGQLSQRFQSRCTTIRVDPPKADEIAALLRGRFPKLGQAADEIAQTCGGDVRAALNDAQMEADMAS